MYILEYRRKDAPSYFEWTKWDLTAYKWIALMQLWGSWKTFWCSKDYDTRIREV